MKKIILFIVMAFLCLSITSCEEETINNTDNDNPTVDNGVNDSDLKLNDDINQNENHHTPYLVSFSSITEMKDFINSTKGNTAQYEKFVQENSINTAITQSSAQNIAKNIEQNNIPLVKSTSAVDEFGATYYLDRNELDIIYKINGIRYRFIYRYNKTSSLERTTSPILEDQKLGTYIVDLYQGDECFVGELITNYAVVQIVVYTEQTNDVTLNVFNMGALESHVEK